jgi:hypothetical protein
MPLAQSEKLHSQQPASQHYKQRKRQSVPIAFHRRFSPSLIIFPSLLDISERC